MRRKPATRQAHTIETMNAETTPRPTGSPRPGRRGERPTPGVLRLGYVFGVPVLLNPSYLVLAVIVVLWYQPFAQAMVPGLTTSGAYLLAVALVLCLFLSVLLHELGHALVARAFGIGVKAITVEMLGGYTEMESESPSAGADLLVSAIGPVVSGLLGVGALGLRVFLPDGGVADQLALQLAWSNLVVAVFNALPGLPLDGGRALRAVVWGVTGRPHTGTWIAGWTGRIIAVGTVAVAFLLTYARGLAAINLIFAFMVALTLWQGASAAIVHGRLATRLPQVDLRRLARPLVTVAMGTPLAEADRQAAVAGVPGAEIAVADGGGRIVALVSADAARAVPAQRRPWVPVESVARTLEPGRILAVDLTGEDVIRAVQANPAQNYLVVAGDTVVGVLRTADLARMLST
jgi:Zn-dependent protease